MSREGEDRRQGARTWRLCGTIAAWTPLEGGINDDAAEDLKVHYQTVGSPDITPLAEGLREPSSCLNNLQTGFLRCYIRSCVKGLAKPTMLVFLLASMRDRGRRTS